jgi:hypothetical protein
MCSLLMKINIIPKISHLVINDSNPDIRRLSLSTASKLYTHTHRDSSYMEHGGHSILNVAISALEDQHSSVRYTAMDVLFAHFLGHHDYRGEAEPHAGAEAEPDAACARGDARAAPSDA